MDQATLVQVSRIYVFDGTRLTINKLLLIHASGPRKDHGGDLSRTPSQLLPLAAQPASRSLETYWKVFRLVHEEDVGTKIDKLITRKMQGVGELPRGSPATQN